MSNWYSGNYWISWEQACHNARIIASTLCAEGWTINAVCGMLGNMWCESHVNPGIWQGCIEGNLGGGFGLVQWTPATKYFNWVDSVYPGANYDNGDIQLGRIMYEVANGGQWDYRLAPTGMGFRAFTQSTFPVETLAVDFLLAYERPEVKGPSVQALRGSIARDFWEYFGGSTETTPTPPSIPETPSTQPEITINVYGSGTADIATTDLTEAKRVYITATPERGFYIENVIVNIGGTYPTITKHSGTLYSFYWDYDDTIINVYFAKYKIPLWMLFKLKEGSL